MSELEYPFHDRTITVTHCGRICMGRRKINLSVALAGQNVGVKQVADRIWLVNFMNYDLGFFDDEACRLEPGSNPFEAKWTSHGIVDTRAAHAEARSKASGLTPPR